MRAVDNPLQEPEMFHGMTAHTTTVQIEAGERIERLLIWFSVIFVALVVGGVIG